MTGVQTCALPISGAIRRLPPSPGKRLALKTNAQTSDFQIMVEHPQAAVSSTATPALESKRPQTNEAKPARKAKAPSRLDHFLDSSSATWVLLAAAALLASLNVMGAFRADEVWSFNTVTKSFGEMMAELRGDIHPPLYYWFLFPWVRLFGDSEFALRSLSALFYLASVFADRKSTRLNSSHIPLSRMPSSA